MERYEGKKVVIIGGTSGMGLATAKMLLDEGASVLVTGRSKEGLDSARKELGKEAIVVSSDARSLTDLDALASQVKAQLDKRLPLHDERWDAAGKYGSVGWHTFRHTYRSWLDETGAPMGVQQKLMRHAQISTTMNVYGNALMEAKREANAAVVRRILRSA
jgi:NAD(P)-dependent dehydrogenase (short-subunit alcohol dehydrogenase family)